MTNLKETAISSVKWTTYSSIISMFAKVGQIMVLSRFLAKEDFGLMAIALLFIAFTEIFLDLGLTAAVFHKSKITNGEYSSLYWFNVFSGFVLFILVYFLSPQIALAYDNEELSSVIRILATTLVFSSIFRLQRTIQQKRFAFRFVAMVEIFASFILFGSSLLLAIYGFGIYSLVFSTALYSLVIALVYLFLIIFKERNIQFHFSFVEIRPFLRVGGYQTGSSILDFFSSQMDILMISSFYSIEVLGIYSIFKQFTQRVYGFVNPIVTKVLTPMLAYIQHDKAQIKTRYLQATELLAFINFPVYMAMAASAPLLVEIIFGSNYIEYSFLFSILCLYFSLLSLGNPVGSLQIALGRTDLGFVWTIYRVISNSLALFLGVQFNIYYCIVILLLVNFVNIWPATKILYKRLADIGFSEYISVMYKSLIISLLACVSYIISAIDVNVYLGAGFLVAIFSLIYGLLSYSLNKPMFFKVRGLFVSLLLSARR